MSRSHWSVCRANSTGSGSLHFASFMISGNSWESGPASTFITLPEWGAHTSKDFFLTTDCQNSTELISLILKLLLSTSIETVVDQNVSIMSWSRAPNSAAVRSRASRCSSSRRSLLRFSCRSVISVLTSSRWHRSSSSRVLARCEMASKSARWKFL